MPIEFIAVVSHTHWDREWYHTAGRFRQRLVPLIDELLDAAQGPFLLDGQTVVLEDYLAVRPERASELSNALRDGTLEAGPWFVLPDELIPSGEGLVRNLLAGARTLRDLRAESPPVLYCPDSFGHPAALPDLAAGFAKALIIVWRGCRAADDAFTWRGREHRVLTYHLSRSGYELGSNLPLDAEGAAARWPAIKEQLFGRAVTGTALLLNGADHHARQHDLPKALKEMSWAAGGLRVEQTSLSKFAREIARRAASVTLGEMSGELRDSYGYTWTLQGTLASRAHQKRAYRRIERMLVRDVEPWAAMARHARGVNRQAMTRAAWRDVLLCQPHDTLSGCSIDAVAREFDTRIESAEAQAAGIREDALLDILQHDRDAARIAVAAQRPLLVLRNPAARTRHGVAEVVLDSKIADANVGPGSRPPTLPKHYRATDPAGLPVQVLSKSVTFARTEAPRAYPDNDVVLRRRALVWSPPVPAFGLAAVPLADTVVAATPPNPVTVSGKRMSNGIVSVAWTPTGQMTFTELATKRTIRGLIAWESREDRGDLYTPSLRKTKLKPKHVKTSLLRTGPLRGSIRQVWKLTAGKERVDATVDLSIDAHSPLLRVGITGDNQARDHRLRVVFTGDVASDAVMADAALGPVERRNASLSTDNSIETPLRTAPLQRYVSKLDASRGLTLYADGLAEYENMKTGIAVTLLRAVGELSCVDLPERPGHAGWPESTPAAQCIGPFSARFAVLLHGPRSDAVLDAIERAADDALYPLTGETLRSALSVPPPFSGLSLEGTGLVFSTCKESEVGDWIVLRCTNVLDRDVAGRWLLGSAIREAKVSRLDETPLERLPVDGNAVKFRAPARATVTILVR